MLLPPLHLILLLFLVSRHTRHLFRSWLALEANWSPKPEEMLNQEEMRDIFKRACFRVHHKLYRRSWLHYWIDDLCFAALVSLLCAVWSPEVPLSPTPPDTQIAISEPMNSSAVPCNVALLGLDHCVLGRVMPECRAVTDTDTLCYTNTEWHRPDHVPRITLTETKKALRTASHFRRHFRDEKGERYATMETVQRHRYGWTLTQLILSERALTQAVHDSTRSCICPAELGVLEANCSLQRYRTEWTLLLDASSGSSLGLEFSEDLSTGPSTTDSRELVMLNKKLRDAGYSHHWRILLQTSQQDVKRVKLANNEEARTCFLYCSRGEEGQTTL